MNDGSPFSNLCNKKLRERKAELMFAIEIARKSLIATLSDFRTIFVREVIQPSGSQDCSSVTGVDANRVRTKPAINIEARAGFNKIKSNTYYLNFQPDHCVPLKAKPASSNSNSITKLINSI